ncbi:MAG TPA: hypothetical protein VN771_01985 [Candidatus Baltobacteraceae bacterium]|nr:hypothetical protein [Candidatus Baltobacteraceae bacterium]
MERTYEKPRLEKLGMRVGARVALIRMADPDLAAELAAFTDDLTDGTARPGSDLIFLGADQPADLDRLAELRACLQPRGGIWVVFRKGRATTLRDVEVMAAGRAAGLIDNKVVGFSSSHTAIRLVIPLADRPRP